MIEAISYNERRVGVDFLQRVYVVVARGVIVVGNPTKEINGLGGG